MAHIDRMNAVEVARMDEALVDTKVVPLDTAADATEELVAFLVVAREEEAVTRAAPVAATATAPVDDERLAVVTPEATAFCVLEEEVTSVLVVDDALACLTAARPALPVAEADAVAALLALDDTAFCEMTTVVPLSV